MKINIHKADMQIITGEGYVGKVEFDVTGHKEAYELVLQSKKGNEWGYSLHFLHEPGPEEEMDAVDEYLDENDEAFFEMVNAAKRALKSEGE
ncbi:hypothetical protein [Marinicrinis lubricantis]|uniref:Uncharacterized protein n=1 Tax=Marinicrinis lubricantis TaxID=2086470 RepID=A0ABW1IPD9_9BACL